MGQKIKDHLGNEYPSMAAMLRHYGINAASFKYRLEKLNMSFEDALTKPHKEDKSTAIECTDHKGNTFPSKAAMCDYWRIPRNVFFRRMRDEWSLEKALTEPVKRIQSKLNTVHDHLGNSFNTIDEMCKHHGISKKQYMMNIRNNCDIGQALTVEIKEDTYADHKGNVYRSINEMCRAYNITKTTLRSRIELGWTLRQILENPGKICCHIRTKDHNGKEFENIKAMCEYHNVSEQTFKNRQQLGLSLKESLSPKNRHEIECVDHKGNKFETILDMCEYWNITTSTYYGRVHKLKWPIQRALEEIAPNQYESFCDDLSIIKRIGDGYYEILFESDNQIWHIDKIFNYYRKCSNIPLKYER